MDSEPLALLCKHQSRFSEGVRLVHYLVSFYVGVLTLRSFVLVGGNLITAWSYAGARTGAIKYAALRTSHLNPEMVTVTSDLLGIIDHDSKQIQFFDPNGGTAPGKPLGNLQVTSSAPVHHISFSRHDYPRFSERALAIIDTNQDIYIGFVRRATTHLYTEGPIKLDTAARGAIWHNQASILAVVRENQLRLYYLPQVLYMDSSLLECTWEDKDIG